MLSVGAIQFFLYIVDELSTSEAFFQVTEGDQSHTSLFELQAHPFIASSSVVQALGNPSNLARVIQRD